ncbi:MAG: hypothetical protein KKB50_18430 [Planctomycetes bacterium]|nr:hypothetical protein [Planctomycetota bacterium]
MDFRNSTDLDDNKLEALLLRHTQPHKHERLRVRVRYSRGADFSGSCYYRDALIYVNLGRHTAYPYAMGTHIAKARSNRTHWWRENYRLILADAYQLVLFVYLHELYHYLIKRAGHSPRRKEGMCDRFATRALVDYHGCRVVDHGGRLVGRALWDFQDLAAFVAAAPKEKRIAAASVREIPVTIHTGADLDRLSLWGTLLDSSQRTRPRPRGCR